MIGLGLSQFLWKNHTSIFLFYSDIIKAYTGTNYLEIGPGHGMFLLEAIKQNNFMSYSAIDISETSLQASKDLIEHHYKGTIRSNIKLDIMDVYNINGDQKYDFITMGEVIEHLETPLEIIKKVHSLLNQKGKLFITTCANCPTVDHIYLFNNVQEIRTMITQTGLKIHTELVLPIENMVLYNKPAGSESLNYAALLEN